MPKEPLFEHSENDIVSGVAHDTAITLWSESRQNEFVQTLQDRMLASRYILERTAGFVLEIAERRKFIGSRHTAPYRPRHSSESVFASYNILRKLCINFPEGPVKVGGRAVEDLNEIAEARANEILSNLPSLNEAVKIIDPETAKKITRIEELKKRGQALYDQVEKVSEPIVMSELDPNTTIGAFLGMVKERNKQRRDLLGRLRDIAEEGAELEQAVDKKLYSGLPGLSDAVISLVKEHVERSTMLDITIRRVEEQVKFGKSAEAVELLRHFENDEKAISGSVAEKFKEALTKLKLSVKKGRALPKKGGGG